MVKTFRKMLTLLTVAAFILALMPSSVSAGGLIPAYPTATATKPTTGAWPKSLQTSDYFSSEGMYTTESNGYPYHAVDGLVDNGFRWRYLSAAPKGEKFATFDLAGSDINITWTQYAFYAKVQGTATTRSHMHYSSSANLAGLNNQTWNGICTTDPKDDIVSAGYTYQKYYSEVVPVAKNTRWIKFAFRMYDGAFASTSLNPEIAEVYVYNDANVVANAKAALVSDNAIKNANVDLNNVTTNLNLPTKRAGATISWASSDPAVKADGTISRPAVGEPSIPVTLTATIKSNSTTDTQTFNATILPLIPVTGVTMNKESTTIIIGRTETLIATTIPETGVNTNVNWTSNNEEVATVDENGVVTAVSTGTADITATTVDGGFTAKCTVTVPDPIPVTGVSLNKSETTIYIGNTETLIPTVEPENADIKTVSFSSSDENIATVNENGLVTAIASGMVDITVTTLNGGFTAVCKVDVPGPVTGISLNKETLSLDAGNSETLIASFTPYNAQNQNIMWLSSNGNIASVDDNGLVNALSSGETEITATAFDGGYTATCVVTVTGSLVNKTVLITAITNATTLINNTPVGTEIGNVPQSAQDDFLTAITDATAVSEDANATQSQVDLAITALALATNTFNAAMITPAGTYNVTGTVSALAGADLTKVSITAKQAGTTIETASVLTDGTFTIALEPGVYTFEVGRVGYLKKIFADVTVTTEQSQILSATAISLVAGDVIVTNQNAIDLQDLQTILTKFGSTSADASYNAMYDLNDDGNINLVDLQAVLKNFGLVQ